MDSTAINLAKHGTDLSSRRTGAVVRKAILAALAQGVDRVTVDCTGVRTLCESFADEVFGVLVEDFGRIWFREHMTIIGLTETTRAAILRAVDARLSHPGPANGT